MHIKIAAHSCRQLAAVMHCRRPDAISTHTRAATDRVASYRVRASAGRACGRASSSVSPLIALLNGKASQLAGHVVLGLVMDPVDGASLWMDAGLDLGHRMVSRYLLATSGTTRGVAVEGDPYRAFLTCCLLTLVAAAASQAIHDLQDAQGITCALQLAAHHVSDQVLHLDHGSWEETIMCKGSVAAASSFIVATLTDLLPRRREERHTPDTPPL